VFQFARQSNPIPDVGHFFNCTVNISKVKGADPGQPLHELPDSTASIAAGAIGLEGFGDSGRRQFVRYISAVIWGAHDGTVRTAEFIVGKFAVGVIAAYDMYGPVVQVTGTQSHPGILLKVNWDYVVRVERSLGCGWVVH
jgi:hypothetical protein